MELQRNQTALDFWELAAELSTAQEENAEMIVPDNCPDIARILSATGNTFLQQSEVREGKVTVSGTVRVSVLYIPEKSQTVQAAAFTVPFRITENCPADCSTVCAAVTAEEITARTLNPRKLRLQCRLRAEISAYRFVSLSYTDAVTAEAGLGLELLPGRESVELITALSEQEFTCEAHLHLPQNRGGLATVLCARVHCTVEDTKIIGTKAVVKGRYLADVLLKYDSGACESSSLELPFSHICDVAAPQTARLSARCVLTDLTVEPESGEDGDSALRLSVTSRLCLAASESRELNYIADLYSTAYPLQCEMQELRLPQGGETQLRRQVWQDALEIGAAAERVLQFSVSCGAVSIGQDAMGVPELRTTLRLTALCVAEDGRVLSAERSAEVVLPCPDAESGVHCHAVCGEETSSVVTADGMIVRVPVDFCLRPQGCRTIRCVASVSLDESDPKDPTQQPSLVLRRKRPEESLWTLAKRHDSTVQDILSANGCGAEDELREDVLLLIPRRRV